MNLVNIRLHSQQLVSPQYDTPSEVVSHMGAMQAQEYRMMRWAVAMRTRKPSYSAFEKEYNEGKIIRLHLLRGTWQLVSVNDYWWMLDLCSAKAARVIRGWMSANQISLPEDEISAIRSILEETAATLGSATKEDFASALAQRGIFMDDHRLSYHIRFSELDGILCSGNLHPSKATYALTKLKVGNRYKIDADEALLRLTRKYFQSHAPATLEDFVWWSGLSIGQCRKGISLLQGELFEIPWNNRVFFSYESRRHAEGMPKDTLLLPAYDEYLIGYKSRDIALPPEHTAKAHSKNGIFYPVIAQSGIICGNWKPFEQKLNTQFFNLNHTPEDLTQRWNEYQNAKIN